MPATERSASLRGLLVADYTRLYDGRGEGPGELRRKAPERFLTNPSLHAVTMIRAALAGPAALLGPWRQLLLATHSIDLEPGGRIGPGLVLPHPFGLLLTAGIEIGSEVTLYHNVTIGTGGGDERPPVLGDRVTVHTNAVISPGAVVGEGAVVGANSIVRGEVPAGAIVKRGEVERVP
jgi:serine O-acetyltransferase